MNMRCAKCQTVFEESNGATSDKPGERGCVRCGSTECFVLTESDPSDVRSLIDPANGIRFGVIPSNDVLQAWAESSRPVCPDPEPVECTSCGGTGEVDGEECTSCGGIGDLESDWCEPLGHEYSGDGYECTQFGDDSDIFIIRSPFYTLAAHRLQSQGPTSCSPCAPGAVYLRSANPDGVKGYCFGHDWFDGGRAPYPVYRVDTGEEVPPPAKD